MNDKPHFYENESGVEAETAKAIGRDPLKRFRATVVDSIIESFAESMVRNALIHWRRRPWTRPPWQSGRRKSVCEWRFRTLGMLLRGECDAIWWAFNVERQGWRRI